MKKISMLLSVLCVSLQFVSASLNGEEEFVGNWTASYPLKSGLEVKHTPEWVRIGGMQAGKGINFDCSHFNDIPLKAPLKLEVNSTKDQFEHQLRISGLMD